MKDNKLDNLFKDSMDNFHIPFNSAAWDKMAGKLDGKAKRVMLWKRILVSFVLLLFVLSISTEVFNSFIHKISVTAEKKEIQIFNTDITEDSVGGLQRGGGSEPKFDNNNHKLGVPEIKDPLEINEEKKLNDDILKYAVKNEKLKHFLIDEDPDYSTKVTYSDKGDSIKSNVSPNQVSKKGFSLDGIYFLLSKPGFPESLMSECPPFRFLEDTVNKEEKIVYRDRARLGLEISPDISSAIGVKNKSNGYNAGVILEFFLVRNVSVSASFIKSKKIYSIYPSGASYGATGSIQAYEIEGECDVFDIPLSARYYFLNRNKLKAYSSAGIANYLMRKEEYTYEYKTYNKSYYYSRRNNHLFAIVNFSAGVDYKVGNDFSIGLEPFLKLPSCGIGEGKLKLRTWGLFLSVNYTFLKNRIVQK